MRACEISASHDSAVIRFYGASVSAICTNTSSFSIRSPNVDKLTTTLMGGKWKLDAMEAIGRYLRSALDKYVVVV